MALSVPLSRPTLRVGGGSAFFVRHQDRFKISQSWLVWRRFEQFDSDEQAIGSSFGDQLAPVYAASKCGAAECVSVGICLIMLWISHL